MSQQRNAGRGPWVAASDLDAFKVFAEAAGHKTKVHPDPFRTAVLVQHGGHWCEVVWNKNFRRYTADKRLSLLVQSFAASRPNGASA